MEDIEKIKKKCAVFLLRHESMPQDELIEKTASYFEDEISDKHVSKEKWKALMLGLTRALALDRDLALALDRDLARDLALDLDLALARDLNRALDRDRDRDLDLVNYLLPLLGDAVPFIDALDARILNDIKNNGYSLEMSYWHKCATTHCRSGFCELYAGDKGEFLVKHFGHWMCGALIYLKSTGRIPDFYASNEDALDDIKAHA